MKVVCSRSNCKYSWDYKGKLKYVTCPSCQRKTKVR